VRSCSDCSGSCCTRLVSLCRWVRVPGSRLLVQGRGSGEVRTEGRTGRLTELLPAR